MSTRELKRAEVMERLEDQFIRCQSTNFLRGNVCTRAVLIQIMRSPSRPQAPVERSRIILAAAGECNQEIACGPECSESDGRQMARYFCGDWDCRVSRIPSVRAGTIEHGRKSCSECRTASASSRSSPAVGVCAPGAKTRGRRATPCTRSWPSRTDNTRFIQLVRFRFEQRVSSHRSYECRVRATGGGVRRVEPACSRSNSILPSGEPVR
jgi:hypothetical protein